MKLQVSMAYNDCIIEEAVKVMFHKGAKIIIIVLRYLNSAYAPMQSANPYRGYRRFRATAASSLALRTRRSLVVIGTRYSFGFLENNERLNAMISS